MSTAALDFISVHCVTPPEERGGAQTHTCVAKSPPPKKKTKNSFQLQLISQFEFKVPTRAARCCDNRADEEKAGRCFWMKSCHICFWCLRWARAARLLLRRPPGAAGRSGLAISHSLSSQGLWASTDFTGNCSPRPVAPLLFGQLWIFSCYESNSVRHTTVRPDSVSAVVCGIWVEDLSRMWLFSSFRFGNMTKTVRWPKSIQNILDISFSCIPLCDGPLLLSKPARTSVSRVVALSVTNTTFRVV